MSAPTNVITNRNTSVNASTLRLMLTSRSADVNHCHNTCLNGFSGLKFKAIAITMTADRITEPAPIIAIIFLGRFLPNRDKIKNPRRGNDGIRYKYSAILLFFADGFSGSTPGASRHPRQRGICFIK